MQVEERHVLDVAPASPCPVDNRERRWRATNDVFLRACGLRSLHAPLRSFALVAGFGFRCVGMDVLAPDVPHT